MIRDEVGKIFDNRDLSLTEKQYQVNVLFGSCFDDILKIMVMMENKNDDIHKDTRELISDLSEVDKQQTEINKAFSKTMATMRIKKRSM